MNSRVRTVQGGNDGLSTVRLICKIEGVSPATAYRLLAARDLDEARKERLDESTIAMVARASEESRIRTGKRLGRPRKTELVLTVRCGVGKSHEELATIKLLLEELGFCVGDRSHREAEAREETTPETTRTGRGATTKER